MKLLFFVLIVFSVAACDLNCETCSYITESNQRQAELNCQGAANDYPDGFREITNAFVGEVCKQDRGQFPEGTIEMIEVCDGVTAVVRGRLVCN